MKSVRLIEGTACATVALETTIKVSSRNRTQIASYFYKLTENMDRFMQTEQLLGA